VTRSIWAVDLRAEREGEVATLLVASAGGHLQELFELLPRLDLVDDADTTWVTFDTPQARSLLAGADVVYAPYPRPRDLVVTARHIALARRVLGSERKYSYAVSTGSSIAVPFLAGARLHGASCHYIESATRRTAPSLTGRILACVPGISLYAQVPTWRDPPWRYEGNVFQGYEAIEGFPRRIKKVAVATGSSESFAFRQLLEAALEVIPPGAEVTWQTGSTPVDGLPIEARPGVPSEELAAEFAACDVVITHAGVGLSLLALASGRCPVLVPRRAERREHVDDHQREVAAELDRRCLAVACEADKLTTDVLERAAARSVVRVKSPPVFHLVGSRTRFPPPRRERPPSQ
jgi:UDP-N-acetylglucosamine:LPS N-acetylglucosamine transferase